MEAYIPVITASGASMIRAHQNLYMFDTYCTAQLNRSINLIDGFCALVERDNYIAAFPLVRLHLDTLQRLYAIHLIDGNVDDIASQIFQGRAINTFNAKPSEGGAKLTDRFLSEKISCLPELKWVKDLYLIGNDFIHFTDKHMMASMAMTDEERTIRMVVARGSSFIDEADKIGACLYMGKITDTILWMVNSWIAKKASYKNY